MTIGREVNRGPSAEWLVVRENRGTANWPRTLATSHWPLFVNWLELMQSWPRHPALAAELRIPDLASGHDPGSDVGQRNGGGSRLGRALNDGNCAVGGKAVTSFRSTEHKPGV